MAGQHRHARLAVAREPGGWTVEGALDVERAEAVLQRLRRPQGPCLRLRRQHPRVHRPRGRPAQVEGRPLRPRPARRCCRIRTCCSCCPRRASWRWSRRPRPVHRSRADPGDRGQDLEPPGGGRRRPARSQRPGDGRVPAVSYALDLVGTTTPGAPRCRCGASASGSAACPPPS